MWFRLKGTIEGFVLRPDQFEANVTTTVTVNVQLRHPNASERLLSEESYWTGFAARAEIAMSPDLEARLGDKPENLAFNWFPVEGINLQSELGQYREILADSVLQVLNALRWRFGMWGARHPIDRQEFYYSIDGDSWGFISEPWDYRMLDGVGAPASFYAEGYEHVQDLLAQRHTEPIGHDVFRESWSLRFNNPRSALILGIVAAEVGVRRCIANLDPAREQAIRADKLSLVPLLKKLRSLLQDNPRGVSLAPSDEMIATVQAGVNARNAFVHGYPGEDRYAEALKQLEGPRLDKLLATVADLLWLFDYYVGHDWARHYIRATTLQLLMGHEPHP